MRLKIRSPAPDEIHFLFSRQLYDSLRLKFFNDITDKYYAKVLFLFSNNDPFVCRSTAAFVFQALLLRHENSSLNEILDVVIFSLISLNR